MLITRLFQNITIIPRRNKNNKIFANLKKKDEQANWPGGITYPGFTYYPKPGEVDPPYEASKLFMIQRTGPWKGTEYWYKYLLFLFKLDPEFKKSKITIVKNTPTNCARLWKIKHLIKVTPITFPDGEPKEEDVNHTYLNHKGELRIRKSLNVDPEVLEEKPDPKKLTKDDLRRQSLYMWQNPWKSLFDN